MRQQAAAAPRLLFLLLQQRRRRQWAARGWTARVKGVSEAALRRRRAALEL